MTKPPEGTIEEGQFGEPTNVTGDYWVLKDPNGQVVTVRAGPSGSGEWTVVCFHSEAEANEFKRLGSVPAEFVATYIPQVH